MRGRPRSSPPAHLEGAVHLDLWGVSLIDTSEAPLRAFMWMIGHLFSLRGVTPDRPVVVYEQDAGLRAARVFWFLEYLGHPARACARRRLRCLDARGATDDHEGRRADAEHMARHARRDEDRDLGSRATTGSAVRRQPLSTREATAEHSGEQVRAKRGGAIPGAVHLEWKKNLTPDGHFKPIDDLRAMYEGLGVTSDREVITYCQGGYRAAHTYLALRRLGYPNVRNYTGSWKEWGDRVDLPIERPGRPGD